MTTFVEIDDHTTGILAALNATAVEVGRGETPSDVGWQGAEGTSTFKPYMVLHTINAGFTGPCADAEADVEGVWQVTAVGMNEQQCSQVADLARRTLRTRGAITITNRHVDRVRCEALGPRRDNTVTPAVWISTDRFRISTTPA